MLKLSMISKKGLLILLAVCLSLLMLSHLGFSQTQTSSHTTSGTVVFGAGITSVNVSMWGGGGGGSAGGGIEYSGTFNQLETYYTGAGGGGSNWTGADVAVAISGVAGPGGGSEEKPVGTVWFAWGSSPASTVAVVKHFEGDRDQVRRQAVLFALQGVNDFVGEL